MTEYDRHEIAAGETPGQREDLVFDLYGTLVDPIAIAAELAATLPAAMASQVALTWRQKQIEYSFRLTMMERFENFEWITEKALDFALLANACSLPEEARSEVLEKYDSPTPFPDVLPALELLKDSGYRLYILSNGSTEMLQRCLLNSGLAESFTAWISVDDVRAFKPVPQVYQLAAKLLGRPLGELRLISCNPFDVVGGKAAGMRTAWVNRLGGPFDTIGETPDIVCSTLSDLVTVLIDS